MLYNHIAQVHINKSFPYHLSSKDPYTPLPSGLSIIKDGGDNGHAGEAIAGRVNANEEFIKLTQRAMVL
jgi:hypothetical protein